MKNRQQTQKRNTQSCPPSRQGRSAHRASNHKPVAVAALKQAATNLNSVRLGDVLQLQQAYGNQAISALLNQPKNGSAQSGALGAGQPAVVQRKLITSDEFKKSIDAGVFASRGVELNEVALWLNAYNDNYAGPKDTSELKVSTEVLDRIHSLCTNWLTQYEAEFREKKDLSTKNKRVLGVMDLRDAVEGEKGRLNALNLKPPERLYNKFMGTGTGTQTGDLPKHDTLEQTAQVFENLTGGSNAGTSGFSDTREGQLQVGAGGVFTKEKESEKMTAGEKDMAAQKDQTDLGAGITGSVGGIFSMGRAVQEFITKEGWEKLEGLFSLGAGVTGVMGGISKAVDAGDKVSGGGGNKGAESVDNWSGSFGSIISAVKGAYDTVKMVYNYVKEWYKTKGKDKDQQHSGGEQFKFTAATITGLLATVSETMKTVNEFYKTCSSVSIGFLGQVMPGLDIVISAITIIKKVYDTVTAWLSYTNMKNIEQDFKKNDAQYVKVETSSTGMLWWKKQKAGLSVDSKLIEVRKAYLELYIHDCGNQLTPRANQNVPRKPEVGEEPENKTVAQQEKFDIELYQMSTDFKGDNQERMIRSVIDIGQELVSIAGSITTLAGQPIAGYAIKTVVIGIKGARHIGRAGAQVYHNVKGDDKSAKALYEKRAKNAKLIFQMLAEIGQKDQEITNETDPAKKGQGQAQLKGMREMIEMFIKASGANAPAFYRFSNKIPEAAKYLIESQANLG